MPRSALASWCARGHARPRPTRLPNCISLRVQQLSGRPSAVTSARFRRVAHEPAGGPWPPVFHTLLAGPPGHSTDGVPPAAPRGVVQGLPLPQGKPWAPSCARPALATDRPAACMRCPLRVCTWGGLRRRGAPAPRAGARAVRRCALPRVRRGRVLPAPREAAGPGSAGHPRHRRGARVRGPSLETHRSRSLRNLDKEAGAARARAAPAQRRRRTGAGPALNAPLSPALSSSLLSQAHPVGEARRQRTAAGPRRGPGAGLDGAQVRGAGGHGRLPLRGHAPLARARRVGRRPVRAPRPAEPPPGRPPGPRGRGRPRAQGPSPGAPRTFPADEPFALAAAARSADANLVPEPRAPAAVRPSAR